MTIDSERLRESNIALVERFRVQWLNEHDLETFLEICCPDMTFFWGVLGDGRGVDGLRALEESARVAFPDMEVTPQWVSASADFVVRRSTVQGTHRGVWLGVQPTGVTASWSAMEAYRVESGRIAAQWLNEDWAHWLRQVGALPLWPRAA